MKKILGFSSKNQELQIGNKEFSELRFSGTRTASPHLFSIFEGLVLCSNKLIFLLFAFAWSKCLSYSFHTPKSLYSLRFRCSPNSPKTLFAPAHTNICVLWTPMEDFGFCIYNLCNVNVGGWMGQNWRMKDWERLHELAWLTSLNVTQFFLH